MKFIGHVICIILVFVFIVSCKSSKEISEDFNYFQEHPSLVTVTQPKERLIQTNDVLVIQVISKSVNQDQASVFNLQNTVNSKYPEYVVSTSGEIDIPFIGFIKVGGKNRQEASALVNSSLQQYVKDPVVLIRFADFRVAVLGEVKHAGIYSFKQDNVTVLEALASAGDLTDYGKRDGVMVIRKEQGQEKIFYLDLRKGDLFSEAAFQLLANDVIYVDASSKKLKNLRTNPNGQRGLQIVVGLVSLASALVYLLVNASK